MRYFSMFTGVGGFELGIQKAYDNKQSDFSKESEQKETQRGGKWDTDKREALFCSATESSFCVGFSEIDRYCSQLLANKFPEIRNYGDCTKIVTSELPDFDLLVGGFPCQSFSIAGKRKGFEDTRGTLFFEICRIAKDKRPRLLLLENVKGLLSHDEGKTFGTILVSLDELGYDVEWVVLNSKFFGVPQNRERVFIIRSLRGTARPEILPIRETNQEFNAGIPETQTASSLQHPGHSGGNYRGMNVIEVTGNRQGYRVYNPEGISNTLPSQGGGITKDNCIMTNLEVIRKGEWGDGNKTEESFTLNSTAGNNFIINKIRRLTPIECERLQGFPDGWTEGFSDTQRYRMMGNAVTVNVIEAVMDRLKYSFLEGSRVSLPQEEKN